MEKAAEEAVEEAPPPREDAGPRSAAAEAAPQAAGEAAGAPGAGEGPRARKRGRGGPRRKVCSFCVDGVEDIGYKDVARLRRYVSDRGRMEPRRKTGTCAKHQRRLTTALKRARHLALLPYTPEHVRVSGFLARS